MRLLASLAVVAAFLLAPSWARAQTSGANTQSKQSQCRAIYLPSIGSPVKVAFKDGRKIKGKIIAERDGDFDVSRNKKTETIACADVARVDDFYSIGRSLKIAFGITLFFTGIGVGAPGYVIQSLGAEKVGRIVAAPGEVMIDLGVRLMHSD